MTTRRIFPLFNHIFIKIASEFGPGGPFIGSSKSAGRPVPAHWKQNQILHIAYTGNS